MADTPALGVSWERLARGAGRGGLEWRFCRPPVVDLEFEMDVRAAAREIVL